MVVILTSVVCMTTIFLWLRSYVVADEIWITWGYGYRVTGITVIATARGRVHFYANGLTPVSSGLISQESRQVTSPNSLSWEWKSTPHGRGMDLTHYEHWWCAAWGFGYDYGDWGPSGWTVWCPHWFVVLLGALGPFSWIRHRLYIRRRARRRAQGLCLECGYDLRASSMRCSECGRVTHLSRK
jgi:hypothetical protein